MRCSLITFSKGRKHHLEHTLPLMLQQEAPWPYRVVVVDYDCPDGTAEWVQDVYLNPELACPALCVVRLETSSPELNRSRARNLGAIAAGQSSDLLAFVDADACLQPGWLANAAQLITLTRAAIVTPEWNRTTDFGEKGVGCCVVDAGIFHEVNGYDESFEGWGWEDSDFWLRCQAYGHAARSDGALIQMIGHPKAQRVAYHATKNPKKSKQMNMERAKQRIGPVNPDGYGRLRKDEVMEVWRRS